jgi:hypothetical protein
MKLRSLGLALISSLLVSGQLCAQEDPCASKSCKFGIFSSTNPPNYCFDVVITYALVYPPQPCHSHPLFSWCEGDPCEIAWAISILSSPATGCEDRCDVRLKYTGTVCGIVAFSGQGIVAPHDPPPFIAQGVEFVPCNCTFDIIIQPMQNDQANICIYNWTYSKGCVCTACFGGGW